MTIIETNIYIFKSEKELITNYFKKFLGESFQGFHSEQMIENAVKWTYFVVTVSRKESNEILSIGCCAEVTRLKTFIEKKVGVYDLTNLN